MDYHDGSTLDFTMLNTEVMETSWWKRRFLGVRWIEYIVVLCSYFLLAVLYHITLWINHMSWEEQGIEHLLNFNNFMSAVGLAYSLMLLLTIPIWWVLFVRLQKIKLRNRLLLHLIGLPTFVIVHQQLYYYLSELLGYMHLSGNSSVWDIYIPGLLYIIQFGIFHAYSYYHQNQRNLALQAELREMALQSDLAALKAQLNPHFLYNVFNTISASVPLEQEKTREMIAQLSDLFRYQLKGSRKELLPLKDEISMIRKYLDLEKARFGERLRYKVEVDPSAEVRLVPPMILQPLVENAVRHGISPKIDGGTVQVIVKANADYTVFTISDDGVGMSSEIKGEGVGLENTKQRLKKQFGESLKITASKAGGVSLSFKIPANIS